MVVCLSATRIHREKKVGVRLCAEVRDHPVCCSRASQKLWGQVENVKTYMMRTIWIIFLRSLPFKWSGSTLVCLQLTCEGFHEPTNGGEAFSLQKCGTIKRFHKLKLSKISTAWTGKEPTMTGREMIGRAITVTGKTLVAFIISRLASNESWSLEFFFFCKLGGTFLFSIYICRTGYIKIFILWPQPARRKPGLLAV